MWNARLDELQAGIKIAGRNINHLTYADDTTLIAENEEELKILMRVKEENEKPGLKHNIKKLRSWHPVLSLHAKYKGKKWCSDRFPVLGFQNHCGWWLQTLNWKTEALWK